MGAISWKRVPPEIGQECAPNPLSYDKIKRGKIRPRFLGFRSLREDPLREARQRGPPGNEGLPATTASRQRGLPGNEGLPATRASRLPARRTSRQRGLPGNEGLPATRASRQRGPPATRASRQRGSPGNEGFPATGLPATRASRQQNLPTRAPGNEGLPATRAFRQRGPPGTGLEIEAGFCHVKFCHKIKDLEHILGRSRGGTLFQDVAPTKWPHGPPQLLLSGATHEERSCFAAERGPDSLEHLWVPKGLVGLPATRASGQRVPPGNDGFTGPTKRLSGIEDASLLGNEGLRNESFPTRDSTKSFPCEGPPRKSRGSGP